MAGRNALLESDDDVDLNLSIPIKPLIEEFACPICFNNIKDCYITSCGHNFCKNCIFEHQCPCCNKEAIKDRCVKNHHLDKLIEKEEASKKYFENLIKQKPAQAGGGSGGGAPAPARLSPIEELFHRHLKKGLLAYEEYHRELREKTDKSIDALHKSYAGKMAQAGADAAKIAALKQELDNRRKEMEEAFQESSKLLLGGYDAYMSKCTPNLKQLPVTVSVFIPGKNIKIPNLVVGPEDNIKKLREVIKVRLAEMGNPLIAWTPSNIFTMKRPLESGAGGGEEIVMMDEARAIVEYKVDPGSTILIKGEVQLKSDLPKECFTATYKPGDQMDYFSCADCKINWICRPCAETCHKDHAGVKEYIMKHTPTWACCYCVKNHKCKIVHKKPAK